MWRSSGVLYLPYIFRTLKRVYKPTVVKSTKLLKMSSFCRNMACGYRERAGLTWATSMCGEWESSWPSLSCYTRNIKFIWICGAYRYFEHPAEQVSQCAGRLSFRVRKVIVHILKWMRNLTGSQCNRCRIRTEWLKRGPTTLARQFWTRCNLVCLAYCEKVSYHNLTGYWPVPLQMLGVI